MKYLKALTVAAALPLVALGCGGPGNPGAIPEPEYKGATRDMIDNPLGKGAGKTPKLSPKMQAAVEKARAADPRGH